MGSVDEEVGSVAGSVEEEEEEEELVVVLSVLR